MKRKLAFVIALALALAFPFAFQAQAKLVKISAVTASSSANIQFTGLGAIYNTYLVNCTGLLGSAAATINVFVGEGAGPTWETGANYTVESFFTGAGNLGANAGNTTTASNVLASGSAGNGSTTLPQTFRIFIDNVSSATLAKNLTFENAFTVNGAGFYYARGGAYWNADTNAITGIELVPASGTIASGTCTLFGLSP